jgi:hypothetical protein
MGTTRSEDTLHVMTKISDLQPKIISFGFTVTFSGCALKPVLSPLS